MTAGLLTAQSRLQLRCFSGTDSTAHTGVRYRGVTNAIERRTNQGSRYSAGGSNRGWIRQVSAPDFGNDPGAAAFQ